MERLKEDSGPESQRLHFQQSLCIIGTCDTTLPGPGASFQLRFPLLLTES